MNRTRLAALLAVVAVFVVPLAADAATPDKGSVSKSTPKVDWGGELTSSGIFYNAWAQDPSTDCSAPACDTFTLTVPADEAGHNVTLTENNDSTNTAGGDPGCGMNIKFPDGT